MGIYFDLFCAAAVLVGYYAGYRTGVVGSLFCVASGFFGMLIADTFGHLFPFSHGVVFAGSIALFIVLGLVLRKICASFFLGFFDRLLGGICGIVLVLIIVTNVLAVYDNFKGQPAIYDAVRLSNTYKRVLRPWKVYVPPFSDMSRLKNGKYLDAVLQESGIGTRDVVNKIKEGNKKFQVLGNKVSDSEIQSGQDKKTARKKE